MMNNVTRYREKAARPLRVKDGEICPTFIYMRPSGSLCGSPGCDVVGMMCGGDAWVMRGQRGGGVDHPNEVQQNKAQTHTHIFHTPGVLVTL